MMKKMALTIDCSCSSSNSIGAVHGITPQELAGIKKRAGEVFEETRAKRLMGEIPFFDLPYKRADAESVERAGQGLRKRIENFVVLGIGGSALGAKTIFSALCHPLHNLLPKKKRHGLPRIFIMDNIDPDSFSGLLESIDPRKTTFNVISKSGKTLETMAQFAIVRNILGKTLGRKAREHIFVTTEQKDNPLSALAQKESYTTFVMPDGVGGRFSVLTPVGLFPASVMGVDIKSLLAGARASDEACQGKTLDNNPALLLGSLLYLMDVKKGKRIVVMMSYADSLVGLSQWFCQLWAESLGKRYSLEGKILNTGQTPIAALGATDQHSQLQLYLEGPKDKVIAFLSVEKYRSIRRLKGRLDPPLSRLNGRDLGEILRAEQRGVESALMKESRPSLRINIPQVNAKTLGQIFYLLEAATVYAGGLYGINPFDQPGVELAKKTTMEILERK